KPVTINMGKISGKEVRSFWFNPKNGETKDIGRSPNSGQKQFNPPTSGYGHDWVLVIDDSAKDYPLPGSGGTSLTSR
ncbi:MAG TPA: putative collagen-binding domain-containing protein, partial [Chitinophagaceae bacterium]|nr:putative collagen-binding domain-containing protein [Chitinophagaceae bacterium]